jgi:hypothetical protein
MSRVIKATPTSTSGVEVSSEYAKMYGDSNNLFYTDSTGTYIVGNVSIHAQPDQIKIGSLFNFPKAYEMMVPSTVVSPRSMLIPSTSMEGFKTVADIVGTFLSELPAL